jgi:hypothetical protein
VVSVHAACGKHREPLRNKGLSVFFHERQTGEKKARGGFG